MTLSCQKCRSAEATVRVTERGPSGSFEAAHYCEACAYDFLPPVPPIHRTWPSADELARALSEAAAIAGRPLTAQEALESASAYFKTSKDRGPGGGVSPG